ncbi:hypothetical protein CcaverHIS002_0608760 [Cutaneotrichosporon cavernicola]|uniref:Pcc1-domain-containing protein n=1 Tax=Cutaneotrichosporon cavernicola TaxID=279322 RepID=A0AA48L9B3_9TREE|nr:uncharacterized protein CcaverHIS019_0608210 [Cutaneotrichosporon cavernicola]BEI86589.1 hypothetical protein CcaverHIS002_0608760 [Cutaneotrichosporon cavernicola]BEI94362.1 hypothetical protein CcaverHIS019_0608210 [Cutaneotrichosporon cavernicola]BEJ02139.1 hypothetical protein CcaverHIS631_0608210 [Cutaneotrichosporon cavernicola]BEJ09900.1 hypothetical protein CcaverHIS641_0608150 [Cutaneotrichosporon cavernicola]
MNGASTPVEGLSHVVTLRIPFLNGEHAAIAKRALDVDREVNMELVERETAVEGSVLVVTIRAATIRIIRLATNAFLSSADLVLRTMAEFAPDPDAPEETDAELDAAAAEARRSGGGMKGIELKGGVGAGGGEEVK